MMIISGKDYLIDTNILIYSQDKKSPKYLKAIELFDALEGQASKIFITIHNLLEYSAVLSRFYKIPKKKISEDIKLFIEHPAFSILYPTEEVTKKFLKLMESNPQMYVYDLYLVAYMKSYGIDAIITDDEDFKEIKGIEVINPF